MVAALVGLGHRRIAFLAGPRVAVRRPASGSRGTGGARRRRGSRSTSGWSSRTTFDADGGALGVDALLAGGAPFTAVCCANDLLALGALQRLAELGIDVPGAVSVAGFDDISTAAMTAPSLSTVRLPLRELGPARVRARRPRAGRRRAGARGPADRGRAARVDRAAPGRRPARRPPAVAA